MTWITITDAQKDGSLLLVGRIGCVMVRSAYWRIRGYGCRKGQGYWCGWSNSNQPTHYMRYPGKPT